MPIDQLLIHSPHHDDHATLGPPAIAPSDISQQHPGADALGLPPLPLLPALRADLRDQTLPSLALFEEETAAAGAGTEINWDDTELAPLLQLPEGALGGGGVGGWPGL